MASLVVVTGPPGAGKSVVARALADRSETTVLIPGDAFFEFLGPGAVAPWLPAANRQNEVIVRAAAAAAGRFVAGGFSTVYDGVLGPWFLAEFASAAALDHLDYVVLLPPVQRCVSQVASRVGHGFTDEDATRSMYRQFAQADIARRHVLADLSGSPAEVAAVIERRAEAGELRWRR